MSRLRFSEISNIAVLTPPTGKATVFLDSVDNILKAKLDDGSLVVLSVTQEYLDDLVSNLLQDSVTIDFTYDDVGNKITGEVIQSALDISLIPNTPSGNLTSTNVQAALNELQSDIDTRALSSSLTAHENLTAGVHGVVGSVVGTTDTQTLTNKTINIDNNTLLNVEVDNLKTGVLNTSVTMTGASDSQVPSALAIKTYVDNKAASQNEASEITYDNTTSGLTATNVQTAIDEVVSDLNQEITDRTNADTSIQNQLTAHITDAVDAHDASAISNTPSGNLTSTDVQSALNELQSELDGVVSNSVEVAQDAVGSILLDSANIDFTYNDGTPSITADLIDTAVTPGSYGSTTQVSNITVDSKGRINSATSTSIAIPSTQITDFTEASQDAIGSAISSGTQDGVSVIYNDISNSIDFTNTNKGTTAVTAHEAALDPHPQYLTLTEGDAAYTPIAHVGSGGAAHANATTSVSGFMSSSDKTKLDGISGTRIFKSGVVAGAAFLGAPRVATVTFSTAMPNVNYSIVVTGANSRSWSYQTKTVNGFVINSNANGALAGEVSWQAISNGETVE